MKVLVLAGGADQLALISVLKERSVKLFWLIILKIHLLKKNQINIMW